MLTFLGVVLGLALLIGGGGLLVRGASEIAAGWGISPMIVGLTIVGFGTSSPELVVNVVGAVAGETELAFGNVVGSNIGNLSLVLGLAAIMMPIAIQGDVVRRELPLLLLATTVLTVMALDLPLDGVANIISRTDAVVLLLLFCIFIYITILYMLRMQKTDPIVADIGGYPALAAPPAGRLRWVLVAAGGALLVIGGELTVRNGAAFASQLGVSTAIIGLFVVAIGTSMPELVTSIIAAVKGESDLALGNVVGSNLFNSLIVLPVSGSITQIDVPKGGIGDLAFSWALTAVLIGLFYFGGARLGRPAGAAFVAGYLAYVAIRLSTAR